MTDDPANQGENSEARPPPFDALQPLASQERWINDDLRHLEVYTLQGLLTLLWHGAADSERVVIMCGGGMGGLLGAGGVYQDLGTHFAARGIATIRVGYRRPNHLPSCVHDLAAAGDLAARTGARRFVTVGHSFGGAVAIQTAAVMGEMCRGVVTLATQSAGCEDAGAMHPDTDLLLLHGDQDELLPVDASMAVRALAGRGEVEILPGVGHLMDQAVEHLRRRLGEWIPSRLEGRVESAGSS